MTLATERISDAAPAPAAREEILIALEADLTVDGRFGGSLMEVSGKEVQIRGRAGRATLVIVSLADIATAHNEPLVGGGRLEVTLKSGEVRPVVAYTASLAERFSEAAQGDRAVGERRAAAVRTQAAEDAVSRSAGGFCRRRMGIARRA